PAPPPPDRGRPSRPRRVMSQRGLEVRRVAGADGDRQAGRGRSRVLQVVERDVAATAGERGRRGAAGPGTVDAIRHLDLPGRVVLAEPAGQQVPGADRLGQLDREALHLAGGAYGAALD